MFGSVREVVRNKFEVGDEDQNRLPCFPALEFDNPADRLGVKGIRAESVERVGAKGDHDTARDDPCGLNFNSFTLSSAHGIEL